MVKLIFNKDKLWLCQLIEASCNALLNALRLFQQYLSYLKLLCELDSHISDIVRSTEF